MHALAFFSPETFKLVMQSLNPIVIGGIAAAVVRVAVTFRRLSRLHRGLLVGGLVVSAYLVGAAVVDDVDELRDLNDTANVDVSDLEVWRQFQQAMVQGDGDVLARARRTGSLDIENSASRLNLQTAYGASSHQLVDVLCLNSPVRGSDRRCDMSLRIYSSLHDRAAVDRVMARYGYDRRTKLLLYCQEGFTSSRLAYILGAHGYDASWAALRDIRDHSIIDTAFAPRADVDVVIKPLRFDPRKAYAYFLFEFDDQNTFAYRELYNEPGATPAQMYRNVEFAQVPDVYDLRLLSEAGLDGKVTRVTPATAKRLARRSVICRNPLHCYLTKLYLASAEVRSVREILCVRCTDN